MTTFKAQEYLENWTDKEAKKISLFNQLEEIKLSGELTIQDYSELTEIWLPNQELTALIVINCPNLEIINVRNNHLIKLETELTSLDQENNPQANKISEIIAGQNELKELNLSNSPQLKSLILPDNPYLAEIKGINWSTIRKIDLTNSPQISLAKDYEALQRENEDLIYILREARQAELDKKLVLTKQILTKSQIEEAIKRLLQRTINKWRNYFESEDENIVEKELLLGLDFQYSEERTRAKKILGYIIEAYKNGNYSELINKWNKEGKDYDGSLFDLTELTESLNPNQYEQQK